MDTYSQKQLDDFFKEMQGQTTEKLQRDFSFSDWKPYPACRPPKEGWYPIQHSDGSISNALYFYDDATDDYEFIGDVAFFMEENK